MINPQNPSETIMAQNLTLTVHADTACKLFESCKRVSFVTSVSAMRTAAGLLAFNGQNAANQAHQLINIAFSYDM